MSKERSKSGVMVNGQPTSFGTRGHILGPFRDHEFRPTHGPPLDIPWGELDLWEWVPAVEEWRKKR